jgi:hypothetical protein
MIDGIRRFFGTVLLFAHRRHVGIRDASSRNNLMFEPSGRAYNNDMSSTAMVAMHVGTMVARRRDRRNSPVVVQPRAKFSCASCQGDGQDHEPDEVVGFCPDCIERSRFVADDDIGGEG